MYKLNEIDDFVYLTFPILDEYDDDLIHCFTTRKGGVSKGAYESLNIGFGTGDDDENIRKNNLIVFDRLGINIEDVVETHQTHTNNIRYVDENDKGRAMKDPKYTDIDGIYTDKKNVALMSFHADCSAVFFYDPVKKLIGLSHAGWKGTLTNIAGKMINALAGLGSNPSDVKAAISPSLGQCCFEVDRDVADMFLSANIKYREFMIIKGEKYHFDLWGINKYNMIKEGMNEKNIEVSNLCTKCRNDLFFSHRGQKGKRGLMTGIIMMKMP
ncbi:MAG TPA: peptidoglycan editing factor PgeF [Sedimentibacter sp.]|nr:peptidoglycan editing factor PgeF [Sedimentibacter sp.]HPW99803.1 peptidoglycan editing factor PgeF [Sedimentibacter sp.]